MKFNNKNIINILAVVASQIIKSQSASVKVSESELNNFKYGKDEFTMSILGDT